MSAAPSPTGSPAASQNVAASAVPLLTPLSLAAVLVTALSPASWLVAAQCGLVALLVIAAARGWGAWPVRWLRTETLKPLQRHCLALALGLGVLATVVLLLGVAGVLNNITAWLLVAVGVALAYADWRTMPSSGAAAAEPASARGLTWRALAALPLGLPLAIAAMGASLPPGVLWSAEGQGYDALIYHLRGPQEYFDAGRISFLPHNVYTSFPQQVESLYLLLMHLLGDVYDGAIASQWLHALLGGAAVLALVAWSPPGWPRVVVALVGGGAPWLAYLGCLAYVELGTLFFAAVAGGLLLDLVPDEARAARAAWPRLTLAAGLCAGLAGGTKYTALVLVAAALGAAWLIAARGNWAWRGRAAALYMLGAAIAFSPWAIRNVAFTGNPVYPFAYRWFGGAAWSPEQDAQWQRGHLLPASQATPAGRLATVYRELVASPMYGPILAAGGLALPAAPLLLLPLVGLAQRSRATAALWLWLLLGLAVWALATHMPGRFLLPLIAPLALLSGLTVRDLVSRGGRWRPIVLVGLALVGSVASGLHLHSIWREHDATWAQRGWPLRDLAGRTDVMLAGHPLADERVLPAGACVWMVGEARVFYLRRPVHYTIVFNRDPWLEAARDGSPAAAVEWLRTQNVTHVVFSWPEIERLRSTYGFPDLVTHDWVSDLETAGLERVPWPPEGGVAGVEVYRVAPPAAP
ncbi:MAG: hypothetical protein IPM13_04985 [Phycisphaerales bacterium]|nr:hypothetical protein [Phycisphaerales bacterium]